MTDVKMTLPVELPGAERRRGAVILHFWLAVLTFSFGSWSKKFILKMPIAAVIKTCLLR